ncbi:MAG TPA: hypothetical protein VMU67_15115 [Steroidobacteraceae bacterium]|nr:hypothetical protein [Steroidobacteraceae bacterium]
MNVNPTQAFPHETVRLHERKRLLVTCDRRVGQSGERTENLGPLREIAARQLANDESMRPHLRPFQQADQRGIASTQMIYPD